MPTYDYTCKACGNEFERFESITAAPNKACPKCGKKKAERQISAGGGFIFKGTGFYLTDYKKGGAAAVKTDDKPAEKKESAPAAATTTAPAATGASCATGCGCHSTPAPAKSKK